MQDRQSIKRRVGPLNVVYDFYSVNGRVKLGTVGLEKNRPSILFSDRITSLEGFPSEDMIDTLLATPEKREFTSIDEAIDAVDEARGDFRW